MAVFFALLSTYQNKTFIHLNNRGRRPVGVSGAGGVKRGPPVRPSVRPGPEQQPQRTPPPNIYGRGRISRFFSSPFNSPPCRCYRYKKIRVRFIGRHVRNIMLMVVANHGPSFCGSRVKITMFVHLVSVSVSVAAICRVNKRIIKAIS